VDDLDHLPLAHLVQVLLLVHHQMLEVHYQNLLPLVPEFVLLAPVVLEVVSKSVAAVELLVKE
jgi:hypothetical protein